MARAKRRTAYRKRKLAAKIRAEEQIRKELARIREEKVVPLQDFVFAILNKMDTSELRISLRRRE